MNLNSSLSDIDQYKSFCVRASIDLLIFENFRQNKCYKQILEHVNAHTGFLYLKEIAKTNPALIGDIDKIKLNDQFGNPDIVEYDIVGEISPSTLRYAKVLSDLLNYFNTLDKLKIVEIGVGYGGQCRVINSITKPDEYTLVDIKPALLLTQTYLDNFILPSTVIYKTMNELKKEAYDLVISNYAFTELRREIQDIYLDKIIMNAKHGYITYNQITPENFKSYKKEELLEMIPNSKAIEEIPLTHEKNCIIIW